jgi:hypothetical protein
MIADGGVGCKEVKGPERFAFAHDMASGSRVATLPYGNVPVSARFGRDYYRTPGIGQNP